MITAPDNSWVYLGVPKTGTTTLHRILQKEPINGIYSGHQHDMPPFGSEVTIYASIRHPYTRALSLWRHYLGEQGEIDFLDYIQKMVNDEFNGFFSWTMSRWLRPTRYDKLIRMEHFDSDIRSYFGIEEVPITNTTRGDYELSNEAKLLIQEWAAEDFESFGYIT